MCGMARLPGVPKAFPKFPSFRAKSKNLLSVCSATKPRGDGRPAHPGRARARQGGSRLRRVPSHCRNGTAEAVPSRFSQRRAFVALYQLMQSTSISSARTKQVPPLRRIIRKANDPAPVGMTGSRLKAVHCEIRSRMSRWFPPFPKPGKDGAPSPVALRSRSRASDNSALLTQGVRFSSAETFTCPPQTGWRFLVRRNSARLRGIVRSATCAACWRGRLSPR